MKVLWFSLSPCSSTKRFKKEKVIQGWMISLENAIKKVKNITLEIAYNSEINENPFEYDGVKYYPIYIRGNSLIDKIRNVYEKEETKNKRFIPMLKKIIEQSNPDVIHIHGTESFFCSITNVITDKPIVYSIQGIIAPCIEQYFAGYPMSEIRKYDTLKSKLTKSSTLATYNKYLYCARREKDAIKKAQYIIGRTQWDYAISKLYNPNVKYYVVNEILREPFYNTKWNKEKFNDKLILISTISPGIYKGYETLLKAAALLKEYATFDFEWRVAGYENTSRWVEISEQITGYNSAKCNIKLIGMKNAQELVEELKNADIYCHTSHIENSPNSVCEAMIIGMPVIATFVGGTDCMLEHNKEGILYQDGDPFALAAYISELQNNFNKAKEFGIKARLHAIKRHDKDNIIQSLLSVYNNIAN